MRGFSWFAAREKAGRGERFVKHGHRSELECSMLETRQMLTGVGVAAPAAPVLVATGPTVGFQGAVVDNSITPLVVPAHAESPGLAGPGEIFIVPAPIPAFVVNLGASSSPATNHMHLGLALSEEQPTGLTHYGQGGDRQPHRTITRQTPPAHQDVSLIDVIEPLAPRAAPAKPAPAPPVVAPPAAAPPAAIQPPAPDAVLDALLEFPQLGSVAASTDNKPRHDLLAEATPSMGCSAWVGLAATAAGSCRLVWTHQAKDPWSTRLGGQGTPGRRFRFPLKARS